MKKFDPALIPAAPDLSFESALWAQGIQIIAGVDEAGRGALAGPVTAAAVILPADPLISQKLSGVRDSKQMKASEREVWQQRIRLAAICYGLGFASHLEIDDFGIAPATRLAVQRAVDQLTISPQHLLVDYLTLPELLIPQTALVKGDMRSLSIAAASVLAKTARDAQMRRLAEDYPGYGFGRHKGYGTQEHIQFIKACGPCPIHRKSFHLHQQGDE
jgi:ribonuclease HII